jgi:small subunit ribosomal protein S6
MAQRLYELTFILPPTLAEDEVSAVQASVTGWITDGKGEVVKASHWGRRRLAYPIQNYKEGYYILLEVNAEPGSLTDLERRMRLEANILRHLVVRVEN